MLDAAFRRVGVLRVNTIAELFDMAEVLAKQPRPRGPRLAIVTNAGGPARLRPICWSQAAVRWHSSRASRSTRLNQLLPPHWSRSNPVDILGDAGAKRYAKPSRCVAKDPNNDGLLVILTPQAMTEPTATAEQLRPFAKLHGKPILASWMGGDRGACRRGDPESVPASRRSPIPTPRRARSTTCGGTATTCAASTKHLPSALTPTRKSRSARTPRSIIRTARKTKRTLLTEVESKEILAAYGIPVVETHVASSEEEAVEAAKSIGGSGRAQGLFGNDHAQDRRGRREVEPARRCSRPAGVSRNRASGQLNTMAHEHFLGVTVEADDHRSMATS